MLKLTVLWSTLSSYSVEFLKKLSTDHGWRIQLVYYPAKDEAPYNKFELDFCEALINANTHQQKDLKRSMIDFSPSCILMCSWNFRDYMRCAKHFRKKGVPVIAAMDNQWHGTVKQRLGVLFSRWLLKPYIDTFLVAGDRQAYFARKLGYHNVLHGLYAGVVNNFVSDRPLNQRSPSFLFVGRLVSRKGFENLIAAYRQYRSHCPTPWRLKIAGVGELKHLMDGVDGIDYLGFIQPEDLPKTMQASRCLILPSLWEPWGVVIHEAAAAGLPIIATHVCGAVTYFVRDGVNGFIIPPNVSELMEAMFKLSTYGTPTMEAMRFNSMQLAHMWTPEKLAAYFAETVIGMQKKGNGFDKQ